MSTIQLKYDSNTSTTRRFQKKIWNGRKILPDKA